MRPDQLSQFLQQQKQQQRYRQTRCMETAQQPHCRVDGKDYLAFCSNDYLGLANHPNVIKAMQTAADQYGVGSGAAHLINGHSYYHQALEVALAEFTQRESALLFSTGYMANLGMVTALTERQDVIYQDKLNHASLLDAAQLASGKLVRYPHNQVDQLAKRMEQQSTGHALIAVDGVFSMDGDKANLPALVDLAKRHQAWLCVDDAHGFGVLGQRGAGLLEEQQLTARDVPVLMATLGKAVGTAGAFIAGSQDLIDYLKQTARSWIYTTAMPAALAAASLASLQLIMQEAWRREQLAARIQQFRFGVEQLGFNLMPSTTAIQPIILGSNQQALVASEQLAARGLLVTAIRPPTVPENTARLRITLSAAHTEQDVERLLQALADLKLPTTWN